MLFRSIVKKSTVAADRMTQARAKLTHQKLVPTYPFAIGVMDVFTNQTGFESWAFDKSGEIGRVSLIQVQGQSDVVEDVLQQIHALIDELPLGRKYSLSGTTGFTTCEGPQFCAVPVVPCAHDITGRPSFGPLPLVQTRQGWPLTSTVVVAGWDTRLLRGGGVGTARATQRDRHAAARSPAAQHMDHVRAREPSETAARAARACADRGG